jgi:hypothetical protein
MSAFQPKVHHVKPVEVTASLDESALALAEITSGSARRINMLELNGVRLDTVDVKLLNVAASATTTPAAPYIVKGFYVGSVAGDSDVVGTTAGITFNATAASETISVDAGGRRFDKVVIGLEITGGTTGLTADIQADVIAVGKVRGPLFGVVPGGDASSIKAGSSLAFDATTTDFTVTVGDEVAAIS